MLNNMIGIADHTEINAFVIDVKDELGKVAYNADVALAKQEGSSRSASRTSTPSSPRCASTTSPRSPGSCASRTHSG